MAMPTPFNLSAWLVDRHVENGLGSRVALRFDGRSITYSDLHARVCAMAAGLRGAGFVTGDRMVCVLLDSPELFVTFLAATRIGAVPVMVNPLLPPADVAGIVDAARPRLTAISEARSAGHEIAGLVVTGTDAWTTLAGGRAGPVLPAREAEHGRDTGRGQDIEREGESADTTEDSEGFWLCTSGSTGRPKLALHRHGDVPVTVDTYARTVLAMTPDDRSFSVGPAFHAYGLGNSLTFPLALGGTSILEATRPPTPARVAEIVTSERPTLFYAVPAFFAALCGSDIADDTFASVRHAVSAAEALPAETWRRFRDRFGVEILDGIGSTEMLHIFCSNHPGNVHPGTSGTPVEGYELRIVDGSGTDVAVGTPGDLWIRGRSSTSGYFEQPEATAKLMAPGDGWISTGDTYIRDTTGVHTYWGRSDDMLRVGGEWVAPAEVEATLIEHESVLEAAVVGERDGRGITRPIAFVTIRSGSTATPDALIEHCRSRLAGYKRPVRVEIRDSLPKTATGKIQRYLLRSGS